MHCNSPIQRCVLVVFFASVLFGSYSLQAQSTLHSPVSAADSLKYFELEDGWEIQLVASEPQVVDPVAMQIDDQGRIWVVEMRDYPSGIETPLSRIVVLQDRNHDGYAESSTVFAEGLRFATGLQPWKDGVIVTLEGELQFLRDTNRDGKADTTETWLTGFATGNSQLRANHPTLTSDGWLTIASGLRGGVVVGHPTSPYRDQNVDLASSDLRIHLLRPEMQSITGTTQFGLSFDGVGRRYGCSNRQPCFEVLVDRDDINLSPLAGFVQPWQSALPGEADSKVFPLVNAWTTSNLHAGQFTAACGLCVTQSPHFDEKQGLTALVCEPTGSLVQRQTMERKSGLAKMKPRPGSRWQEWVASRDPWFRPVDLYEGPQGMIYIVDMYRAVIEHPEWVPTELKNRPDQRFGDSHGRIYRMKRKGKDAVAISSHEPASPQELLSQLRSPNAWDQTQASRRILQRISDARDTVLIDEIQQQLTRSILDGSIASASHCLGLLFAMKELTVADFIRASKSDHREIRVAALRLAKSIAVQTDDWKEIGHSLQRSLTSDDREEERLAAWLIAHWGLESAPSETKQLLAKSLTKLLQNCSDDRYLWMAIAAATRNEPLLIPMQVLKTSRGTNNQDANLIGMEALERLTRQGMATLSAAQLEELSVSLFEQIVEPTTSQFTLGFVLSIGNGMSGRWNLAANKREALLEALRATTKRSSLAIKLYGIRLVASLSDESDVAMESYLLEQLESDNQDVVSTTISALAKRESEAFANWLVESFVRLPQRTRAVSWSAILANNKRITKFLDRIETGRISIRFLDPNQFQALSRIKDSELSARVAKLSAMLGNADRDKLVQKYETEMKGLEVGKDPAVGKELFRKHCASCHKIHDMGIAVGPDISDSREQSYAKLLISILDPNRGIDANYFRFLALTEDGETVEGLLRDSNGQSITLEGQNGVKRVLSRSELTEFRSSGVSMMPEGFENQMPPAEMGELIWYIKNWRYVVDNVPAVARLP